MLIRHNYDGKRGSDATHIRLVPGSLSHDGILLLCDMLLTHGTYEVVLQCGESRGDLADLFKSLLPYRRILIITTPEFGDWDCVFAQVYHHNLTVDIDGDEDVDCDILVIDGQVQHKFNIGLLAQKTSILQLSYQ
jgi:hypothetical protein